MMYLSYISWHYTPCLRDCNIHAKKIIRNYKKDILFFWKDLKNIWKLNYRANFLLLCIIFHTGSYFITQNRLLHPVFPSLSE